MMKDEAAKTLTECGYPAAVEDGVVKFKNPLSVKDIRAVKIIMKEIGYKASYGWRTKRKNGTA